MKPDAIIIPQPGKEDTGHDVLSIRSRRRALRWGLGAGALALATITGALVGPRLLDGGGNETQANVEASLPSCGNQKGGTTELIIVAGRDASVTVRADDDRDRYVSLSVGDPGQITVREAPGAEQPPLRPGQDGDTKNFDFEGDLVLSIDPGTWQGPGHRTQLVIAKSCTG